MVVLVSIGLGWLTVWFIIQMIVMGFKAATLIASKKENEFAAGLLGAIFWPICNLLAIATTVGALFAIHG